MKLVCLPMRNVRNLLTVADAAAETNPSSRTRTLLACILPRHHYRSRSWGCSRSSSAPDSKNSWGSWTSSWRVSIGSFGCRAVSRSCRRRVLASPCSCSRLNSCSRGTPRRGTSRWAVVFYRRWFAVSSFALARPWPRVLRPVSDDHSVAVGTPYWIGRDRTPRSSLSQRLRFAVVFVRVFFPQVTRRVRQPSVFRDTSSSRYNSCGVIINI